MIARCLVAALLALSTEAAMAQTGPETADLPRTADGRPDLQGVWESRWFTLFERMPGMPAEMAEADMPGFIAAGIEARAQRPGNANPDSDIDSMPELVKVGGTYRTSLIIDPPDGRLPFTPEGRKRANGLHLNSADQPEHRTESERCIVGSGRAPMISPPTNAFIQIVQPPGRVMIMAESMNDVRELRPGTAQVSPFPTFRGDAASRWEGDSLVIETTNMRDEVRFAPLTYVVLSPQTVVVERIAPVSATEFRYSYTVSDPVLYTRPWSAETTYVRSASRTYEYACHEGNYALANILRGGREADRRALLVDR